MKPTTYCDNLVKERPTKTYWQKLLFYRVLSSSTGESKNLYRGADAIKCQGFDSSLLTGHVIGKSVEMGGNVGEKFL